MNTTTQPTPRSSSPNPVAILPWHKAAAAACFEKTSNPFFKDIAESIARHDPAPEMASLLGDMLACADAHDADAMSNALSEARALLARINGEGGSK